MAKVAAWAAKTECEAGRGRGIWILAAREAEIGRKVTRRQRDYIQTPGRRVTRHPPSAEFVETQYIFMQII